MAAVGGEETSLLSPRNRFKFLCSHGGKILPRAPDGQLKYIGGDTRVIAVHRDITFSGLMKKLNSLFGDDVVLKYQLIPEDLDALVSVTCDEDLNHMLDEYDQHDAKSSDNGGTPRLRAFLFPSNPTVIENQAARNSTYNHALEQRYIDAINGVLRTSSNISRATFSTSSNGSSPNSILPTDAPTVEIINHDAFVSNGYQRNSRNQEILRVQSSPTLYSLGNQHQHHHHHHHHHHPTPQLQQQHYQSSRLQGPYSGGNRRLISTLSMGQSDIGRSPTGYARRGSCGCLSCGHVEESKVFRCVGHEMADSLPYSPSRKQRWE